MPSLSAARPVRAFLPGIVMFGLLGAAMPASAGNLLLNPAFNTPSGTGPTSLSQQDVSGPSAAADWLVWNNSPGTTRTELLPSTLVAGGTMMHVLTTGSNNGLYQQFTPAAAPDYACAWVYVVSGFVMVGAGDGPNTVGAAAQLQPGAWEVLNAGNTSAPVSEMIIYSFFGPAEFYVESASVGASHAQCKAK